MKIIKCNNCQWFGFDIELSAQTPEVEGDLHCPSCKSNQTEIIGYMARETNKKKVLQNKPEVFRAD